MLKKFIAWLKAEKVITAENEVEMLAKLKSAGFEEEPKTEPIDTSKLSPEMKTLFDSFKTELTAMRLENKELRDALGEEKSQRDKGIKAQQDRADAEAKAKREALIVKALKEGKIPEAKKEWLTKLAEKAYDEAEAFVNDAPVMAGFKPTDDGKGKDGQQSQGGQPAQTPTDLRAQAAAAFGSGK